LPLWLLMLGCRLPYAAMKLNEPQDEVVVDIDSQEQSAVQ
jgi:hypothetical protein